MSNRSNITLMLSFWAILGAATFVRLWNIGGESLRLDESQSLWQATHSIEFIFTYMLKNVHLPMHNSLLHYWLQLFGSSEVAVRMLSVIPGILSVVAIYFLAKEFLPKRWALFTMFIASIAPFWVWYSQEIRMYTILTLVSALSYLFFVRIQKTGKTSDYVFYALVNLVGIYTHYFFFLVLMTHMIFFFTTWKKSWKGGRILSKEKLLLKFSLVALFLVLAFAPWLYGLAVNHGSGSFAPMLTEPTPFNMVLTVFEFLFGYQPESLTSYLIAMWPLFILLGFIFLGKRKPFTVGLYLLVLGTIFPIVLMFTLSKLFTPMYLSRYLIVTTPTLFVLFVWFLSQFRGATRILLVSLVSITLSVLLVNQFINSPAKEDYRAAAAYIAREATVHDIIALSPPYMVYPFQYYYQGVTQVTTVPIWNKKKGAIPQLTQELLATDAEVIRKDHKRLFLLSVTDLTGATESKEYFDRRYTKLDKRQFSKYLWVNVYKLDYSEDEKDEPAEEVISTEDVSAPSDVHVVAEGETLYIIAERYFGDGKRFVDILKANEILDADRINVGDILRIPEVTP